MHNHQFFTMIDYFWVIEYYTHKVGFWECKPKNVIVEGP